MKTLPSVFISASDISSLYFCEELVYKKVREDKKWNERFQSYLDTIRQYWHIISPDAPRDKDFNRSYEIYEHVKGESFFVITDEQWNQIEEYRRNTYKEDEYTNQTNGEIAQAKNKRISYGLIMERNRFQNKSFRYLRHKLYRGLVVSAQPDYVGTDYTTEFKATDNMKHMKKQAILQASISSWVHNKPKARIEIHKQSKEEFDVDIDFVTNTLDRIITLLNTHKHIEEIGIPNRCQHCFFKDKCEYSFGKNKVKLVGVSKSDNGNIKLNYK